MDLARDVSRRIAVASLAIFRISGVQYFIAIHLLSRFEIPDQESRGTQRSGTSGLLQSSSTAYAGTVCRCGLAMSAPATDFNKELSRQIAELASAILLISGFRYVMTHHLLPMVVFLGRKIPAAPDAPATQEACCHSADPRRGD